MSASPCPGKEVLDPKSTMTLEQLARRGSALVCVDGKLWELSVRQLPRKGEAR